MQKNFLLSVWLVFLASALGFIYIILYIEPETKSFVLLLTCLTGFLSTFFSLVWFKLSDVARFEDPKSVFRKCFKKAFFLALFIIMLILVQYFFDIL